MDTSNTATANLLTGLGIDEYYQRSDVSGANSYLSDALGTTLALATSAGALDTTYAYEPFGNTTVSGFSSNPYQFTGRENDGTGLYFYRARYYSARFQRFVGEDPLGFGGGDSNFYAYVENSPIRAIDPLGLCDWPSNISSFFNNGPIYQNLANRLNTDVTFVMALSALESGWLGPDAHDAQNLFGLDISNGHVLVNFASYQQSADAFYNRYSDNLMNADTWSAFVQGLQDANFNTLNPNFYEILNEMPATIERQLQKCNLLE